MAQLGQHRVLATDVQVLTVVLSTASPKHDINFRVFYPDHDTKVASMPLLGPLNASLQYLLLQLGQHKVTDGNCSLVGGYRIVISFRHLGPFQVNDAMVSYLLSAFIFTQFAMLSYITHFLFPFPGCFLHFCLLVAEKA